MRAHRRSTGVGTLVNDDGVAPGVAVGVADVATTQQIRGTQSLVIPVTLSQKMTGPVTVQYTVTPGSATYSAKKTGGGEFGGQAERHALVPRQGHDEEHQPAGVAGRPAGRRPRPDGDALEPHGDGGLVGAGDGDAATARSDVMRVA
jgi:hypothetical protein